MDLLIQFTKIEASGNDFIMFNAAEIRGTSLTVDVVQNLCKAHTGIGADGIIVLRDKHMTYYNSDGSIGEMCGNGLRATTLFAYIQGLIPNNKFVELQVSDGIHSIKINNPEDILVEILHQKKNEVDISRFTDLPENTQVLGFFNTGVPHLVLEVEGPLDEIDVIESGRKIRFDPIFRPEGTNVNFVQKLSDGNVAMRTYERGVEDETLSCGTGAVACSLAYFKDIKNETLGINTKGGRLQVNRSDDKLFLQGAARIVFSGKIAVSIPMNETN